MHKVRICIDLPDDAYQAYLHEGKRRGMSVERLLEQTVMGLLKELDQEQAEGTDHLIIPS